MSKSADQSKAWRLRKRRTTLSPPERAWLALYDAKHPPRKKREAIDATGTERPGAPASSAAPAAAAWRETEPVDWGDLGAKAAPVVDAAAAVGDGGPPPPPPGSPKPEPTEKEKLGAQKIGAGVAMLTGYAFGIVQRDHGEVLGKVAAALPDLAFLGTPEAAGHVAMFFGAAGARLALKYKINPTSEYEDEAIVGIGLALSAVVVINDRRKRAAAKGIAPAATPTAKPAPATTSHSRAQTPPVFGGALPENPPPFNVDGGFA